MHAGIVAQELVVIAGNVDDPGSLARLAQEFLDDIVMVLRPVPGFLQPPSVDDVADQINRIGFVMAHEIEEAFSLASLGAEMHVGDKERTEATRFTGRHSLIFRKLPCDAL